MIRALGALLAVLLLSGCGAAGTLLRIAQELDRPSGRRIAPPPRTPIPSLYTGTSNAPWIRNYRELERGVDWWFIGTPVGVGVEGFTTNQHGNVNIIHGGSEPQPQTAALVREYLTTLDATKPFASPPFVQLPHGHNDRFGGLVFKAVQIVNSALPNDFQIGMDANTYASSIGPPPGGVIRVEQSSKSTWGREWIIPSDVTHAQGVAVRLYNVDSRYGSQVFIDSGVQGEESLLRVLVHEILHTLGFGGHYDFPTLSLMASAIYEHTDQGDTIMFPLDLWGLRAFYDPESYGEWLRDGSRGYEVGGCLDEVVCFGVARMIGDVDPYASNKGHTPHNLLANNPTLQGTVTWRGRLLGLTPANEVVGAATRLGIDLDALNGDLDFTAMEYWPAGQAPGRVGSGSRWGDGDLTYGVAVFSNGFLQDGTGDAGTVTGLFAGRSHEYMTGVLERDDLAAGFGGKR